MPAKSVAVSGICIVPVAAAGAAAIYRRNASRRQRQIRVLLFALYFRLLEFVQLTGAAIIRSMFSQ